MSKLTQQEIEKEREAFERFMQQKYPQKPLTYYITLDCESCESEVKNMWLCWLARAELDKVKQNTQISPSYEKVQRRKHQRMVGK